MRTRPRFLAPVLVPIVAAALAAGTAQAGAAPATPSAAAVDVVLPLTADADVNSAFDGGNAFGEYLKAGTEADGEKSRTYLRFDTRGLRAPVKAVLTLTNVDAPGCGPVVGAGIQVRPVTDFWDPTAQTWTPQPANGATGAVLSTEGSRQGVCGSGRMSWDVTAIVAEWAAGTAKNHGLVLLAPTEVAARNYRVFASGENSEGLGDPPTLKVTTETPFTPGEGDDPAEPGPAPSDQWPGRVEPDTGVWLTGGTDVFEPGLVTTRSHSAGQRIDLTNPNEQVLGPDWRLEPLGGVLGDRLKDFSANGYLQISRTSGSSSDRYLADPARPGTFTSRDGGTVVRNADGTFTERDADAAAASRTWRKVGTDHLITATTHPEAGTTTIGYDAQGRVSTLAAPTADTATFRYATTTTATAAAPGDVAGQLKDVEYDAAGDPPPAVVVAYSYDSGKRLRRVDDLRRMDGEPVATSTYTYDPAGNITQLNTPPDGLWNLTYAAAGKMQTATKPPTAALQPHCKYASQYLWGRDGCWAGPVPMSYGGRKIQPSWRRTPGNKAVVGVTDDRCTAPALQKPGGFDFRIACDMHDYGYGIIYLKTRQWDKSKKGAVDSVFYTTLRDHTCNAYPSARRSSCKNWASDYYFFVSRFGGSSMKYAREY
ncbi:phospholipase A2 [Actinosynnema sp. NPDC047251]|uniref:Carbohydrate-binding module family 96 domain-containing protein n=1 Tax=Saccharothrix espanaensis (strain ATCC 51144 / DSM 44229 / JCM 9112 / NBRC 15066 / NRRL 15764) TaxID=1179773 RepID=K0JUH5_SACES|nr:phospholipase A2 [Saccharothrix espanaensis]CCH29571.1 hypothetical protein BN6_22500 [Saccharothrix espanaensis DSM 44229]